MVHLFTSFLSHTLKYYKYQKVSDWSNLKEKKKLLHWLNKAIKKNPIWIMTPMFWGELEDSFLDSIKLNESQIEMNWNILTTWKNKLRIPHFEAFLMSLRYKAKEVDPLYDLTNHYTSPDKREITWRGQSPEERFATDLTVCSGVTGKELHLEVRQREKNERMLYASIRPLAFRGPCNEKSQTRKLLYGRI